MAIGWLALLQSVPWSEVISNAPKLADGAKKLWNTVGRKPAPSTATDANMRPAAATASPTLAALQDRIVTLEAAVSDLHGQMLASSELIKALAEQNAQLVRRIEAHRRRLRWLSAATAVLAIALLTSLFLAS
jgi:hypothetical protein